MAMKLFATMTILASNVVFAQGAPEDETVAKALVNACGDCRGKQSEGPSIEEGTKEDAQYILTKSGGCRRKR